MKKFSFTLNFIQTKPPLIFEPKIPYDLVAEPAETGEANLTFPHWLRG